jgi:hypothetical protein
MRNPSRRRIQARSFEAGAPPSQGASSGVHNLPRIRKYRVPLMAYLTLPAWRNLGSEGCDRLVDFSIVRVLEYNGI